MKKILACLMLIAVIGLYTFQKLRHQTVSVTASSSQQTRLSSSSDKDSKPSQPSSSQSSHRIEANPPMTAETIDQITPVHLKRQLTVSHQVQEKSHYCVPATVSMILASRGVSVSQEQLAQAMGTYLPFGTHNRDGIRVLNRYLFGYETPGSGQAGYRLETVMDVSSQLPLFKERLKQNIADGYPMYYTLDLSKVYEGLSGEHNVIGVGYALTADETDIALLYYIDPLAERQGLQVLTPEQLLTATSTCQEPHYAW